MKDLVRSPPPLPVEYEEAVRALEACTTIDETKYWANASDALAAWARIYHDKGAMRKARKLKLHAYRRMGLLAAQIRPPIANRRGTGSHAVRGTKGFTKGPRSVLREHGLARSQCTAAITVAEMTDEAFTEAMNAPMPPTPTYLDRKGRSSELWFACAQHLYSARSATKNYDPVVVAKSLRPVEALKAREIATELIEWLDRFEQALPKAEK